ncbi:Uncharacterised protein [Klebsiella variicola]|uniref:hypothetical protein n=1 Tax=Klebsiella variicola TaxID=244366 RepID=UPI000D744FB7|nr:hypothetical protein [Klebsiella variicola]PXH26319.1 hypothetical protein DMR13_24570 [Klebsiella variicola]SXD64703.1 Uncharacterised protein [Klebsiella variicola]
MEQGLDISKLVPFVIFFLGVACSPIIEWLKEKSKAKRLRDLVISSLSDEHERMEDAIKYTINTIKIIEASENNILRLHTPINLKVLERYYLDIYPVITKEQRRGFNCLMLQINSIEEKYNYIKNNWKEVEPDKLILKMQSMLHSIFLAEFFLYEMSTQKCHFKFPTQSDREIIKSVISRYGITDKDYII